MLEIYACTALICAASVLAGATILVLLGWPRPLWLAGATGFAALVTLTPFLIRLPGRATTAAIILLLLLLASAWLLWSRRATTDRVEAGGEAAAVVLLVVALASLPFLFQDRIGVLGEGIYTNDHAAQLYWADWLQTGFGPEPSAVRFGYPIGPQALTAVVGEATGIDLVASFNGLLLAIPALTALAALGALAELPPTRRVLVAALAALPYLAASFLAQSAFKETAMALFVLAFAVALQSLGAVRGRAVLGVGLILAAASVFTFSIPGLAWFGIALALWLVLEALAGRSPVDYGGIRDAIREHRLATALGALVLAGLIALAVGPALDFLEKVDDVQLSQGRLGSPIFPGEVFGIWPEGDFRVVRGEVSGSLVAAALGGVAALYGALVLLRRRQFALVSMLVAAAAVYLGARVFAEIHVEAKALIIGAPLVLLVALRSLLEPDGPAAPLRYAAGLLVALAALGSTALALRAAPVGPDDRAAALERFGEEIDGEPVIFLGVDRFSAYRLRGTLARAPAGYVPQEIENRPPHKVWQQGAPADFDLVLPRKLDKFDYAITTSAAYQSAAPASFEPLAEEGDYVLWRRDGETPRTEILAEGAAPGMQYSCAEERAGSGAGSDGLSASTFAITPTVASFEGWQTGKRIEDPVGGQERGFNAPATATNELEIESPGEYELSLQYHSEAPLQVLVGGEPVAELPPSLEGMYLDGAGRGAFWPAGSFEAAAGAVEVEVRAEGPSGLQDTLGVEPRVWLGDVAATATGDPAETTLPGPLPCGPYVDHYLPPSR